MKKLLKGGVIVGASGCRKADLLIDGERIEAVGEALSCPEAEEIDVSGKLLFPGFLDAHTHFDLEVCNTVTADDFYTGGRSALRGGTTTVIDFACPNKGETLHTGLARWHEKADGKTGCDYGFHMTIDDWNDGIRAELPQMFDEGISSFKMYMTYPAMMIGDEAMFHALREMKRLGGIVGVGEPSGHQYEGHYLQLAGVLGVEKETGFTLGYDKYNWDEHPGHFILEDCTKPVDFGEGKKGIYALPDTEILVQREKEVQMAVHAFGKGRAVYISGLPYSFENSRVLYRSILWSAHDEESLHKWFSSNFNVEVHAYVKNGKYCVVNNTYEPQSTVVYKGDGSSFALDMAANEIKWYEI